MMSAMFLGLLALCGSSLAGHGDKVVCPSAPVKPDIGDRCEWIPILDKNNCIRKYECMPLPPTPCPAPPQFPDIDANCRWVAIRDPRDCIVSWECTPNRSTFDDQHHHCCYWAQVGECIRNVPYMSQVCRASCSVSGCHDNQFFSAGASYECQANHRNNGCPFNAAVPARRAHLGQEALPLPAVLRASLPIGAPRVVQPLPVRPIAPVLSSPLSPPVLSLPTFSAPPRTVLRTAFQAIADPIAAAVHLSPLLLASSARALPPAPPISAAFPLLTPRSLRPALAIPLAQPVMSLPPAPPPAAFLPSFRAPPCAPLDPCAGSSLQPERIIVPVPVKVPIRIQSPRVIVSGPSRTIGFQGTNPANPHGFAPISGPLTLSHAAGGARLLRGALGGALSTRVHMGPVGPQIIHGVTPPPPPSRPFSPRRLQAFAGPPPIIEATEVIAFPKRLVDSTAPGGGSKIEEVVKHLKERSHPLVKTGNREYREEPTFSDKMGLDGRLFDLPEHLIDAMVELEAEQAQRRRAGGDPKAPAVLGVKLPTHGADGDKGFPIRLPEELLGAIRRYKDSLKKRREELRREAERRASTATPTTRSGTRPPMTFWLGARENSHPPARAYITVGAGGITARPISHYRRLRAMRRQQKAAEAKLSMDVGESTLPPTPTPTTRAPALQPNYRRGTQATPFRLGAGSDPNPPLRTFHTASPRSGAWSAGSASKRRRRLNN